MPIIVNANIPFVKLGIYEWFIQGSMKDPIAIIQNHHFKRTNSGVENLVASSNLG